MHVRVHACELMHAQYVLPFYSVLVSSVGLFLAIPSLLLSCLKLILKNTQLWM